MADKKLSEILSTDPVTAAPTGAEPIETVVAGTSEAFTFAQLSNHPLNAQTGTTYTLAITDQGKVVTMSNAATNTATIPLNASVAFVIGTLLIVRQIGAGLTTLAATGGVTIEKVAGVSLTMSEPHEQLILHKVATDTWHVFAGGGGSSAVESNALSVFATSDLVDAFSGSAFATKGSTFTCVADVTINHVAARFGTNTSATYKVVIAEVSGGSDTIDAILATSPTSATNSSVEDVLHTFVFDSPVNLLSGKAYAFLFVRTDSTTTAINPINFPGTGVRSSAELIYLSSSRYASNDPAVSDTARFNTTDTAKFDMYFEVVGTERPTTVASFHGAFVEETTGAGRDASQYTPTFDAVIYDTDNFADLGTDDDRLTVPAGVTKVQVSLTVDKSSDLSNVQNYLLIRHFNSADSELFRWVNSAEGTASLESTLTTPVFVVSEGDYFTCSILHADSSWTQEYVSLSLEYKDGTLVEITALKVVDISTFIQGVPTDAEKLMTFVVTTAFTFPSGLATSAAYAEVTAASAATIDIIKNGAAASGTINFASGTNAATFTLASDLVFAVGDRLQLVNQGTADSTLADISITLRGNL